MILKKDGVIRLTPLVTQVTHLFSYFTRVRNRIKKIKKIKKDIKYKNIKIKNKNKIKKNNFLFSLRDQTFTLGCVTCVLFIGEFLI